MFFITFSGILGLIIIMMIVMISSTGFGFSTYQAYKRTMKILKKHGHNDFNRNRIYRTYSWYCDLIGADLAYEDLLQDKIDKEHLKNTLNDVKHHIQRYTNNKY